MINDAMLCCENSCKYVDDLALMEIVPKSQEGALQTHVDVLSAWSHDNFMQPKPQKCKVLQVSFLHTDPPAPMICINDMALEIVSSLCLLEVTVYFNRTHKYNKLYRMLHGVSTSCAR